MKPHRLCTILAATILASVPLHASDSAVIKAPLHGTGDADATGLALATLRSAKSEFIVNARKLEPSHDFAVEIDGIVQGEFRTDKNGRGRARFRTSLTSNSSAFDFDPRGKLVRVLDGGASVMEGTVSGAGEDDGSVIHERAELSREDAAPNSRARVTFKQTAQGRRTFRVDLSKVSGGPYRVLVDGIERGGVHLRGKNGILIFDSAPSRDDVAQLDFDPRGAKIDIVTDDSIAFSGTAEARARGVNLASPAEKGQFIASTGADPDGSATARLRIDSRARKHFSVELEDVPAGDYELLVDGTSAGIIHVLAVTGGTEGELEFTSGDDDPSELPLTFDPVGTTLTIVQGSTVFFESAFDPNMSGVGTPGAEAPTEIIETLAGTGLIPAASAKARYEVDARGRHKFSVEVEDVQPGSYTLSVGGIVRGTIRVALVNGKVEGEIEFESEREPGHRLLNFDPRGQTIEISSDAGLLFAHLFGNGSAGSGAVTPFDLSVALISTGLDSDATAHAEYQRKETGELSFEVELEDLPVGTYELLVGGIVRGSMVVEATSKGTRGRLQLEHGALNFEVSGQEIAIIQNGNIFFSRTFPG